MGFAKSAARSGSPPATTTLEAVSPIVRMLGAVETAVERVAHGSADSVQDELIRLRQQETVGRGHVEIRRVVAPRPPHRPLASRDMHTRGRRRGICRVPVIIKV